MLRPRHLEALEPNLTMTGPAAPTVSAAWADTLLQSFAQAGYVVAAPVFPLALLAILSFVLMLFGWVEWIPWFGDLFAGLFWLVEGKFAP